MTLTSIPTELIAGDSYTVDLSFTDYSATDWTGTLYLRGKSVLTTTATASGNTFSLSLVTTKTSNLPAGLYQWSFIVSNATDRHTASAGTLTVLENVATAVVRVTHAEKMLSAIEAVLEGRITDDVQQVSISGRSITNIPVAELMDYRAQYMKELAFLTGGTTVKRRSIPFVLRPL